MREDSPKKNTENKTLIASIVGEFGWCVAQIVPAIRHLAQRYDRVVCVGPKPWKHLVRDFSEYEGLELTGRTDRWLYEGKMFRIPGLLKAKYKNVSTFVPNAKTQKMKKKYKKYGTKMGGIGYDVVFHIRDCHKYNTSNVNYSAENFERIWKKLGKPNACCIGTQAKHISGTADLRSAPLDMLCDVLASSTVAVGSSSGPMHLASFCGCPHVVISHDKYLKSIKGRNRDRYRSKWNPFKTPCAVVDKWGWNPPWQRVAEVVEKHLCI